MACKYILRGLSFDSENSLNDYLLLQKEVFSKYGDIVFDMSPILSDYFNKIIDNKKLTDELYNRGHYKEITIDNDETDLDNVEGTKRPYIGTTEFIHKLTTVHSDGSIHQVFPDFRAEEYWKNRAIDLSRAIEIVKNRETRGDDNHPIISDYDIPILFDECSQSTPNAYELNGKFYEIRNITEPDELEIIKTRFTEMWKLQALAGTAIHLVMDLFFLDGYRDFKDKLDIIDRIRKRLKPENLKWINNETLESLVDQAFIIENKLKQKFPSNNGKDIKIITETRISGKGILDNDPMTISGILDMIVIDSDGETHIIDYKCSLKDYKDYNSAKVRTFNYQLNTYARLLRRLGLNCNMRKHVIPIKMENFTLDKSTNKLSFNKSSLTSEVMIELEYDETIENVMREHFPEDSLMDLSTNEVGTFVESFLQKAFPKYYQYKYKERSDEDILETIKRHGGFLDINGKKVVHLYNETYSGDTEAEILERVKTYFQTHNVRLLTLDRTKTFKSALKDALKTGNFTMLINKYAKLANARGSKLWLLTYFLKYANKRWEIIDTPEILDIYGVVMLQNLESGAIDIIKIAKDRDNLKKKHPLNNDKDPRKYILGTFLSDTLSYNSAESPVLEATLGNIELMETMAIVNCFLNLFKNNQHYIGEIGVLNPDTLDYLTAPNKLLLYNFTRLSLFTKTANNFAYNKNTENKIKMASFTELVYSLLKDIYRRSVLGDSGIRGLNSFIETNYIDNFRIGEIDKIKLLAALNKLRLDMEDKSEYAYLKDISLVKLMSEEEHPEIPLYRNVLYAIAELNGLNLNLQITDHDSWMEGSFKSILTEGLNGNYIDNPGTLKSATLNKLASLTETAYQNARSEIQNYLNDLRSRIDQLKESKNFGWIKKVTTGNLTDLYLKMFNPNITNDLVFRNPFNPDETKDLSKEEVDFLINTLIDILSKRSGFAVTDEDSLLMAIESLDDALLVPLCKATSASTRAVSGWLHTIKTRLKKFSSWAKIKLEFMSEVTGFLTQKELEELKDGEHYEMVNRFENSFDPKCRQEMLQMYLVEDKSGNKIPDLSMWEHNLERLLLHNQCAFSMKKHLDLVFPMLKAIVMHLNFSGIIQNDNFEEDLQYARDYIKNKIFNLPLEDINKWSTFKFLSGELMSAMSKVSLGFNVKLLYQSIDGIWKDVMLFILKPDGKGTTFTYKHLKDSFFWIMHDLKHFGDKPTLGEYLNLLFGINDLDTNSLADKISNDNAGMHNFWSLGFRFASRPDYYNRMTIFGALMRADGVFEAFDLDNNGNWKYNIKKDKRFQHFINNETSHPDYQKEKSLFLTMAEEFINEGATYPDGTIYELDLNNPNLPRAYTARLSESMKALGDKIYGYYSHEKRSMMQSFTLGALFWQMNTYWSSKKNLYLSGRTFTLLGDYVLYEEPAVDADGNIITNENGTTKMDKFYLKVDENGNSIPVKESELGETDPRVPYMVWKGRPQEGIFITLANLMKSAITTDANGHTTIDTKTLSQIIVPNSEYWNSLDPEIRKLYNANLRLLLYDLFMLLFIGVLISPVLLLGTKEYIKDVGNDSLGKAFTNNCLLTSVNMLSTSGDDFNFFKSIFGRGVNWQPFSLSSAERLVANYSKALDGSMDFYDASIRSFGALSNNRPMADWVKLQIFDTNFGTNMNK